MLNENNKKGFRFAVFQNINLFEKDSFQIEVGLHNNSPNLSGIRKKAYSSFTEKESVFNSNHVRSRVFSNLNNNNNKK